MSETPQCKVERTEDKTQTPQGKVERSKNKTGNSEEDSGYFITCKTITEDLKDEFQGQEDGKSGDYLEELHRPLPAED